MWAWAGKLPTTPQRGSEETVTHQCVWEGWTAAKGPAHKRGTEREKQGPERCRDGQREKEGKSKGARARESEGETVAAGGQPRAYPASSCSPRTGR